MVTLCSDRTVQESVAGAASLVAEFVGKVVGSDEGGYAGVDPTDAMLDPSADMAAEEVD